MKKKYVLPVLFFLLSSYSFSQTTDQNTPYTDKSAAKPDIKTDQTTATSQYQPVFEKTPLPTGQKVSPEVFYIENDKPTDRQAYQRHIQKSSKK